MALRKIFKVCAKETGYEGGDRFCKQWWRQTAAELQLKITIKEILEAAWEQRRWGSIRGGEGKVGEEESFYCSDG